MLLFSGQDEEVYLVQVPGVGVPSGFGKKQKSYASWSMSIQQGF